VSVSEAAGANVTIGTSRQYGSIEAPKYTDINFVGFNDITNARIRSWDEAYSTAYGRLTFYTGVNGNISENARIDYNGNVGIGTTNPTAKLQLNDVTVANSTNTQLAIYGASTNIHHTSYANIFFGAGAGSGSAGAKIAAHSGDDNYQTKLVFSTASGGNSSVLAERMVLGSNGNLGIGTTNPTAKLDVNGTANFNGIVTMPNQPAFMAIKNTTQHTETAGNTVIVGWNKHFDTQSNFNESNGRFVAPVTGVYLFSLNAMVMPTNGDTQWYIALNGVRKAGSNDMTSLSEIRYRQVCVTALIKMNTNDYVEFKTYTNLTSDYVMLYAGDYSHISGYLIG